ncbi:hypothetical protein [Rhodococcus sp. 27YEA15]|uniref:hypothetical protein n=1 Tax=Rhodococcus sp. 27YEA15 TaxID=3156259 RepID=UPI003C7AF252
MCLGVPSTTGNHKLSSSHKLADSGFEWHLNALLNLKNNAAYIHPGLTAAELKETNSGAERLVEAAEPVTAARR